MDGDAMNAMAEADGTSEELVGAMDALHRRISAAQRELFALIPRLAQTGAWRGEGARSLAHFLQIRYGLSAWKAHRWIGAAHALERLPRVAEALSSGELGVDKALELARFATAQTEADLVGWSKGVSVASVRRRADLAARPSIAGAREAERGRFLSWWHTDEGRRMGLEAELPAADGAVVVSAIEALAARVPVRPGEEDPVYTDARRADALVALCAGAGDGRREAEPPMLVLHAGIEALTADRSGVELEGGGVVHPEVARRLACTARVQAVIEDRGGTPVRLGRVVREPSAWMLRQLRYRDGECRFPGCGARRFTQAHHIVWWANGGRTDLDNLVLVCSFHHKLVHEFGWGLSRADDGRVTWYRPDGTRYRAGAAAAREVSAAAHVGDG